MADRTAIRMPLRAGAAWFLLLLLQAPAPAAETSEPARLQPIVVSARRQPEDAQAVPISIDTFSGESLQRRDIRTTTDLQDQVPGLAICCAHGQANYNFIRGIQGVQAYFAETLLLDGNGAASSLSGNSMYFDLEDVSVLKGPQGTLFGMSTNGGAILFTPRRPASGFGGYVSTEVGNYGRRIAEGVLNLPVGDALKLRLGLQSTHVDGYVTDLSRHQKLGTDDYVIARLGASFRHGPSIRNELTLNHFEARGTLAPYVPVAANPQGAAATSIGPSLASAIDGQAWLGYYRLAGTSTPASASFRQTNASNITTLQLGDDARLRNILGYERLQSFASLDADGTLFRILDNNVAGSRPPGARRLLTEELQLQGEALGGRLGYTAGLFHASSHAGRAATLVDDLSDVFGIRLVSSTRTRFRTQAAYAQGSVDLRDLTPGLKASAGYRYTEDRRWLEKSGGTLVPATGNLFMPDAPLDLFSRSSKGSYTLGLSYAASPRTMVYLSNSKGYLHGGFNSSVTRAEDAPYGPESLNNFELGLKSDLEWHGMQGKLELAAYYGLYRDGQMSVTALVNAGTPQQTLAVLTRNAAQGRVRGLEWHLRLVPDRCLDLLFFGSFMSNRYTRYESLASDGQPIDLAGTPFVFVPRWKYGLSITRYLPVGADPGRLSASLSYAHQDAVVSTSTLHPQWYDRSPAIDTLDLGAAWEQAMGRKGLDASLFVNNLLQNRNANGGFGAYNSLGLLGRSPAVPRMIGLRIRQTF
ncbi:TonB-dependent receptor [Pelomonas sp. KK5]|uniref:TonB-dependent receptor n=1 Tax=Pelomonas sp. KK5 TaxID=1855730 RepID=UPI00097C4F90|nr:TonB-dependent receptor [Pelomonas sp. KK5]